MVPGRLRGGASCLPSCPALPQPPSFFLPPPPPPLPVYLLARRVPGHLLFSSLAVLPPGGGTWRTRLAWTPAAALALAAALLGVALAGPRVGDRRSRIEREGIAIMMVVDTSGSMAALDLSGRGEEQTRLDVVQEVFEEFVLGGGGLPGRPNDAIGLVRFARYADTACPLTLDHGNLALVARGLEITTDRQEDGTAIGDALALAVDRLRDAPGESRVVILLTDGVNNAGDETPRAAAELASSQGVKVYTIGAGSNGVAPVRVEDPFTGRRVLRAMPVQIDEQTLRDVAERTGGRSFRATDGDGLRAIYREIDRLERTEQTEERFREYHEYYGIPLSAALLLMAAGVLLDATVLRRMP